MRLDVSSSIFGILSLSRTPRRVTHPDRVFRGHGSTNTKEHEMGMTDVRGLKTPTPDIPSRSSRKHHWWRWVVAFGIAVIILVVVAIGAFIKQPGPSPLVLPKAAANTPVGPLNGAWDVTAGSSAGFRVQESAVGLSNDTVGRTNVVTGTIAVSDMRITAATFRIDLVTIKVGGKAQPQFATSLGTQRDPSATFTLAHPMALSSAFSSGVTIHGTATGQLAMHGTSRLVTITITGRRDG